MTAKMRAAKRAVPLPAAAAPLLAMFYPSWLVIERGDRPGDHFGEVWVQWSDHMGFHRLKISGKVIEHVLSKPQEIGPTNEQ